MSDRERRQRSKQFGIKLGKLLQDRAVQTRAEHDLDPRYVMLGAAEYLQETAEFQINPPLDVSNADTEQRRN